MLECFLKTHYVRAHYKENEKMRIPSDKTIRDRFNLLVRNRRADKRRNALASGIVEEESQNQNLLDNIIFEMYTVISEREARKGALAARERMICEAAASIRDTALKRKSINVMNRNEEVSRLRNRDVG